MSSLLATARAALLRESNPEPSATLSESSESPREKHSKWVKAQGEACAQQILTGDAAFVVSSTQDMLTILSDALQDLFGEPNDLAKVAKTLAPLKKKKIYDE